MKIAIAGYGVVGRGTHELLMMNREKIAARAGEEIEVKYVLDPKPLEGTPAESLRASGIEEILADPEVQLLGGSVEEEVSFGPMNLRLPVGEVRARVDAAIRSFALEEYRGRAPQYLSGGEKKRVTLADALAMEPQMLLLDEPAASLDPANTRLLEQNLQMLSEQGLGLMVATHDVDFAWRWATRVLVFRGGRLAGDGEPREIFENVSLLRTCGLEQPVLYRVGRVLGLAAPPHTVEELEQEWKP